MISPEQKSRYEANGNYVLAIPYSGEGELVMDILKYGLEVEEIAPVQLRDSIQERHELAAKKYGV